MELLAPTPIALGVIFILVSAYIADLLEKIRKYKGKYENAEDKIEALEDHLDNKMYTVDKYSAEIELLKQHLDAATPKLGPYERAVKTWKEYKDENAVLQAQLAEFEIAKSANVFRNLLEGQGSRNLGSKRPDIIKVEMSEDFKELKQAIDQLGAVAILKKELDRAHKRENVYLTRIAANTGLIEKKISDVTKK